MESNYQEIEVQPPLKERIKKIPMAYYLIAINILVFIILHLTNIFIQDGYLVGLLAKSTYDIAVNHEYYRFFTAIFVHESISHLLFNCFAIYILSRPIESIFGKTKFLIIFIISGLFGTLFSFIFSINPAIGASGGVFGAFGVHLYLFIKNKSRYLEIFGKDMLQLLALNLIIGFLVPNVDYWGHIGGLVGGIIATFTLGLNPKKLLRKSLTSIIISGLIFVIAFIPISNSYNDYINIIKENIVVDYDQGLIKYPQTLEDEKPLLPPTNLEYIFYRMEF